MPFLCCILNIIFYTKYYLYKIFYRNVPKLIKLKYQLNATFATKKNTEIKIWSLKIVDSEHKH